jgi:hypothetical protein
VLSEPVKRVPHPSFFLLLFLISEAVPFIPFLPHRSHSCFVFFCPTSHPPTTPFQQVYSFRRIDSSQGDLRRREMAAAAAELAKLERRFIQRLEQSDDAHPCMIDYDDRFKGGTGVVSSPAIDALIMQVREGVGCSTVGHPSSEILKKKKRKKIALDPSWQLHVLIHSPSVHHFCYLTRRATGVASGGSERRTWWRRTRRSRR